MLLLKNVSNVGYNVAQNHPIFGIINVVTLVSGSGVKYFKILLKFYFYLSPFLGYLYFTIFLSTFT